MNPRSGEPGRDASDGEVDPAAGGRERPHPPGGTSAAGSPPLTFLDLPRLELDQLLLQLVDRAQEVMSNQGRLRGLLRANQLVVGDLALPVVLRCITEAARELVGARYAALGVISAAGGLAEFVHTGISAQLADGIGRLPQGKGLLGALIDDPQPIRLDRIGGDPRSSGFPPGHPPMDSFLGVPIRVRDEVFGNLYLCESTRGRFSAEDEELTTALAATAGAAIDHARLYESARRRGEWLQASTAITRMLLADDAADSRGPLRLIAERSCEIADADLVAVALLDESSDGTPELRVEVAVGQGADRLHGVRMPVEGSVWGRVFRSAQPVRLSDVLDMAEDTPVAVAEVRVGPVLTVPLQGSTRVLGVLWLGRLPERPVFTVADMDMAGSFANQAAVAIELADGRAERQRVAMLDERDRIAADLHDHVIQRLFCAGLNLQSIAGQLGRGPAADRILATICDLDSTITQIRSSIFELHELPGARRLGVHGRLLDVIADLTPALGFEPATRFVGLSEDTVPEAVAMDLLAVLREALMNVARHARASGAAIDLTVTADRLTLEVHDNGVGIAGHDRGGLTNLRRRAEHHGGAFCVTAAAPGTRLTWTVPRFGAGDGRAGPSRPADS